MAGGKQSGHEIINISHPQHFRALWIGVSYFRNREGKKHAKCKPITKLRVVWAILSTQKYPMPSGHARFPTCLFTSFVICWTVSQLWNNRYSSMQNRWNRTKHYPQGERLSLKNILSHVLVWLEPSIYSYMDAPYDYVYVYIYIIIYWTIMKRVYIYLNIYIYIYTL